MPNSTHFPPQDCYDLSATIASGQTTSQEIDLGGTALCGFILPAAFTGATLTLTMSNASGGTFVTVQDGGGSDYSLSVAANKYIPVNNLAIVAGIRFVKLVSSAGEGADRIVRLVTRPI